MSKSKFSTLYKFTVIILGIFALIYAVYTMPADIWRWSFALFFAFTLFVTPLMDIRLPHGNIALSFSDSMIFLAFILYGGEAAILIAATETLSSCVHLKIKGMQFRKWMFIFNIAAGVFATTVTYVLWLFIAKTFNLESNYLETNALIAALGILAALQFLSLSTLHSIIAYTLKDKPFLNVWMDDYFSVSLTQVIGSGLALIVYKLLISSSFLTTGIALTVFFVAYINYRRTISEIDTSIKQAEKAEKEKAKTEKLKTEEAQKHAGELKLLLKKEEEISEELRQSKVELEYSAFHDALTDLPNRAYIIQRLKFLIELGDKINEKYFIVFLDINRFKNINDSLGHSFGDQVLKLLALRLRRTLRDEDSIARLGGDEFAIILTGLSSMEKAQKVANKIQEVLSSPYMIQGNKIHCDVNIGITPLDYEHINPEDVLRDADIAMHFAKEQNNNLAVFDKNIRSQHLERIRLESDLRHAIDRKELFLNYQPIVSLQNGNLVGFEALSRWIHHELGFISPGYFIPISEDSGSIVQITNWVLKEGCRQITMWNKNLPKSKKLFMSLNISGKHLMLKELVDDVEKVLEKTKLPPQYLKLEITESTAMDDVEKTIEILQSLSKLGVQLSIDDFGTGYSSLSYLHLLPFDTIKIDRSFVMSYSKENSESTKILETIISLTKNLNKKAIAEGIETEEQLEFLKKLDCSYGQGYLFSKPLPRKDAEELIIENQPLYPFLPTTIIDNNSSKPRIF